jgi:hypothetical protein
MRTRNPKKHGNLKTIGDTQPCLLCDRNYCKIHSGTEEGVCEIDHVSYYNNHPELRDSVCFPDIAAMRLATYESGSDC